MRSRKKPGLFKQIKDHTPRRVLREVIKWYRDNPGHLAPQLVKSRIRLAWDYIHDLAARIYVAIIHVTVSYRVIRSYQRKYHGVVLPDTSDTHIKKRG
jgi:hypothetical protein